MSEPSPPSGLAGRIWRVLHGSPTLPPDYRVTRWLFLRALGVIHFIAFLSLSVQLMGLMGSEGILPAHDTLDAAQRYYGAGSWWNLPTLGWFSASDTALKTYCYLGLLVSTLLICGVLTRVALLACWALYLSLYHLGGDFLGFQWDILLLETTFLAWFLAPWAWIENPLEDACASRIALWLMRLLLWKLMFFSGCVKLPYATWTHLEALYFHYETQPIPHAAAWFAHQLPHWFQQLSVLLMFFIELVAPWFLFFPRRVRAAGALGFSVLMALIFFTGNYTFFNLLTAALCLLWLDDAFLLAAAPLRVRQWVERDSERKVQDWRPPLLNFMAAGIWVSLLLIHVTALVTGYGALPKDLRATLAVVQPWCVCNSYGLFRSMTTERDEIEVEGSNDGVHWEAYVFRYKPGDPHRVPRWCQPHLDWQMWFAALDNAQQSPWFQRLMLQLLHGSKPVEALFERVPFPDSPPTYIRARRYRYHFTKWSEGWSEHAWWRREFMGEYFPAASLRS